MDVDKLDIDYSRMTEAKCYINFSRSNKKYRLSPDYNGSYSFLFVNTTKIHQFKVKNSGTKKKHPLFSGKVSENFSVKKMKKAAVDGCVYNFSVDYRVLGISDIISIH